MFQKIPLNSIRLKLPVTYAGIALLTSLALGIALLIPLREYYTRREREYLKKNANSIAMALAPLMEGMEYPPADLDDHIRVLALFSQTQVRLLGADRRLLADSSLPDLQGVSWVTLSGESGTSNFVVTTSIMTDTSGTISAATGLTVLATPSGVYPQPNPVDGLRFYYVPAHEEDPTFSYQQEPAQTALVSVMQFSGSMYGFELQTEGANFSRRSDQVYSQAILDRNGHTLGWVELSGGPPYGLEIVLNVANGWFLASLVAVFVAVLAGWWVSRRMSAPLLALTGATHRMASGDLSARVHPTQKDEIGSLGRSFNHMADQVEGTVQTLRRFAADAAHEVHTPLTALQTNLELASATHPDDPFLQRASEQLERVESLINDLLDLSRLESGFLAISQELFNLSDLLVQTCVPFASHAEQAGIDFDLVLPQQPVTISGQPGQLQQAVCNLVENAMKFTPTGGRVTVGLGEEGESVLVWVEDNGIGIAAEDLPLLFNRFHRGRNASAYPGSGLGLAIVKAIAEMHDGQVWAENRVQGARFTLKLPKLTADSY